jgi:hypothetical protein
VAQVLRQKKAGVRFLKANLLLKNAHLLFFASELMPHPLCFSVYLLDSRTGLEAGLGSSGLGLDSDLDSDSDSELLDSDSDSPIPAPEGKESA